MTLSILEGKRRVHSAYKIFHKSLTKNTLSYPDRLIVYRSGNYKGTAYWNQASGYWGMYIPLPDDDLYWCNFGLANPVDNSILRITVQITLYANGIDRRYGGLFIKDAKGDIYVGHTGKIGGGVKGINQEAFWDYFGVNSAQTAYWSDGRDTKVYVIGRLDDPNLATSLGIFVNDVRKLKDKIIAKLPVGKKTPKKNKTSGHSFNPEFKGVRAPYNMDNTVQASAYHGLVVERLKSKLNNLGLSVANDRKRDLYVYNSKGEIETLFEVKTAIDTGSIYSAIGQLMFHGSNQNPSPKRVAVLPGIPNSETVKAFQRLSITILSYNWRNDTPVFKDIKYVI